MRFLRPLWALKILAADIRNRLQINNTEEGLKVHQKNCLYRVTRRDTNVLPTLRL